jgi:toxin ParE1/3/4
VALKVSWSPEALADATSLAETLSRDSEAFAKTVLAKLFTSTRNLGAFPTLGRMVPGAEDANLRELSMYSYRLIYRIEKYQVVVVAIVPGKRP